LALGRARWFFQTGGAAGPWRIFAESPRRTRLHQHLEEREWIEIPGLSRSGCAEVSQNYSQESRMDTRRGARLTVRLVLLSEPSLWCWEIVDTADGAIVESSWTTDWTGYESSPEALRAGIMRLTALAGGGRGHHQKHA